MRSTSKWVAAAAVAVTMAVFSGDAVAGTWTPVDSGLGAGATDIISAVEYQAADRFWFATSSGKIGTRSGSAFAVTATVPGTSFTDIAFQPGTGVGIAVGTGGHIWRSTNGGASWVRSSFIDFAPSYDCNGDIGGNQNVPTQINPALSLNAVAWGPGNRVFAVGEKGVVLRSDDAGASWADINRRQIVEPDYPTYRQVSCKKSGRFWDVEPLPVAASTPNDALPMYFMIDGHVWFTANGLTSEPTQRADFACASGAEWFALDPVNPNRQWGTAAGSTDCLYLTQNDLNYEVANYPNRGSATIHELHEVASAGSPLTVVIAGKGGDILSSANGKDFFLTPAPGADATQDWWSSDGYDTNHFALGGANGRLIVSQTAGTMPDITPPTGSISGPDTVVAGQPATFNAVLADTGGSGVDTAGTTWAADGLPGASGPSATWTYPTSGSYRITLSFRDLAGNTATATKFVSVTGATPPPVAGTGTPTPPKPGPLLGSFTNPIPAAKTSSTPVPGGGTLSLGSPQVCVPALGYFTTRMGFKRSKRKGARVVKVSRVDFFIDGKKVITDKKAPFSQRLTVASLKAGSTHKLKARALLSVKRGPRPAKSVTVKFSVCR